MSLTKKEKELILEQELYKKQVKREIKQKEWWKPKGFLPWLFTIFIIIPIAIGFIPITVAIILAIYINRSSLRKSVKNSLVVASILVGVLVFAWIVNSGPDIDDRQIDTLEYKVRNRDYPLGREFIVNGETVYIGETWDSVYEKLGESDDSITSTGTRYGQVTEHYYGFYGLVFVRNTEVMVNNVACCDCYILWDFNIDNR